MPKKKSAGLLLFRFNTNGELELFLVHPGGPFWKNKDLGAWSIPKGEFEEEEDPIKAARREFKEETGIEVNGEFIPLNHIKQKSGKIVIAWAIEHDADEKNIQSNTFPLEWPPRSGKFIQVPEVDRANWFGIPEARQKILPAQLPLLEEVVEKVGSY